MNLKLTAIIGGIVSFLGIMTAVFLKGRSSGKKKIIIQETKKGVEAQKTKKRIKEDGEDIARERMKKEWLREE